MIMKRERTHEHDEGIEKATPTSTYQQRFRSLKKNAHETQGKKRKNCWSFKKNTSAQQLTQTLHFVSRANDENVVFIMYIQTYTHAMYPHTIFSGRPKLKEPPHQKNEGRSRYEKRFIRWWDREKKKEPNQMLYIYIQCHRSSSRSHLILIFTLESKTKWKSYVLMTDWLQEEWDLLTHRRLQSTMYISI